jgi:mono/diheme cytochrome c family protein
MAIMFVPVLIAACATQTLPPPRAADVFGMHCASCHGPIGEGDGPVAAAIAVAVPNLRTLSQRNGGEFPSDAVASYIDGRNMPVAHGSRMMPVWGDVFAATARIVSGAEGPEPRIEAIVSYLQELQYP